MTDHVGIEMTALAGVHLHRGRAGGTDAVGVASGLLIAFNDGQGLFPKGLDRLA